MIAEPKITARLTTNSRSWTWFLSWFYQFLRPRRTMSLRYMVIS